MEEECPAEPAAWGCGQPGAGGSHLPPPSPAGFPLLVAFHHLPPHSCRVGGAGAGLRSTTVCPGLNSSASGGVEPFSLPPENLLDTNKPNFESILGLWLTEDWTRLCGMDHCKPQH